MSAIEPTRPFGGDIARTVVERGEGLYGIVLQADDPTGAAAALAERGVALGGPMGNEALVFGARLLIEGRTG